MKTMVAITVDTEPSIAGSFSDPRRYKPLIHEPIWGEVDGESQALGFILRTLSQFNLRASFFIETVHLSHFPEEIMGDCVIALDRAGQDLQLHLHPVWRRFQCDGFAQVGDNCSDLTEDQLADLMDTGAKQIEVWCGRRPRCLRTGNFSVSSAVYRAMRRTGLSMASNICVGVAMPSEERLQLAGGVHEIDGIIELPATCFHDNGPLGRGRYRPLQVTACSFAEQRSLLNALYDARGSIAVVVTHPFEFLKWSGPDFSNMRPNRLVQRRFKALCRFLAENSDRFEVVGFDQILERGVVPEEAIELNGSASDAMSRVIENFVNDRVPF